MSEHLIRVEKTSENTKLCVSCYELFTTPEERKQIGQRRV